MKSMWEAESDRDYWDQVDDREFSQGVYRVPRPEGEEISEETRRMLEQMRKEQAERKGDCDGQD